ncbi:EPHX4 hydrolase, partial [Atractosteus spatula]|nr:EPHX4 hydrolase [Atractosteus spatula]
MTGLLSALLLVPIRLCLRLQSLCFWALVYSTAGLTATLVLTRITWRGLRAPRRVFRWTVRQQPPACLRDPVLGEHSYLHGMSSGLRFHYVTKGDTSRPLMLFLHGFPENWFSWRYQLQEFSSEYHTVALDLRGYGDSDAPRRREDYMLDQLLGDIKDVIESLGHRSCVLVGQDWGGTLAWHFAMEHPGLVRRLVVMSAPHPSAWRDYILRHPCQLLRCSHSSFFQIPFLPELTLPLEDFQLVRSLMTGRWVGIQNRARRLTEPELEAYLYQLSQPGGLAGPLSYYRSLCSDTPLRHQDVGVACLLLWGEADAFLGPGLARASRAYMRGSSAVRIVPGCSHWVQQDQPEAVNGLIWAFLREGGRGGSTRNHH